MTTPIGWQAVESKAIPIEENAKNETSNDDQNPSRKARIILRVFAVIRLLITITATVLILNFDSTKDYCLAGSSGGYRHRGKQLEAIEKRLDEHASENGAANENFRFHRLLFINGINILITALLWAGTFANKRRCLPIYAILEIAFFAYFIYATNAIWNLYSFWGMLKHRNHFADVSRFLELLITLFVCSLLVAQLLFLPAFCALFIPKVLFRYYKHLESRDGQSIIYGVKDDKTTERTRIVVRIFAVLRLLISIVITLLILHWYNVRMICWSYFYEGGFLSADKPLETIQKRLDGIAGDRVEASHFFKFYRAIELDCINILVTALLWSGAFANKKNCLPIYAILEIALSCFHLHSFYRTNNLAMFGALAILFIAYCAVFLHMVLRRYYKRLDSENRARKSYAGLVDGEKADLKITKEKETNSLMEM